MNRATAFARTPITRSRQGGAALVVGLVLLMILTLLAISGMNTSTLELQMAGNFQFSQSAFQAAEVGLQRAISGGNFATNAAITTPVTPVVAGAADTYESRIEFDCARNGETVPPPRPGGPAFSIGENMGFSAYHFEAQSTGRSSRGARAVNVQDFYLVRQEGGCPGF
jgi:type IV pilus assembly protein PilX